MLTKFDHVYFLFFLQRVMCLHSESKPLLLAQCTAVHNFVSIDDIEAAPFLSRKINVIRDVDPNLINCD